MDAGTSGDGDAFDGTSGSSDGGASADGGPDTGAGCVIACDAGVTRVPCPAAPPAPGSACAAGQVCEYGSSWWLECNVVMRCEGASWQLEFDGGACPWLDAGGPCPATWAEAMSVDASPASCPFVTCVYPEGFCGCGIGCGGGGGAPAPRDVQGFFTCLPTVPGCPEPRPRSGTACEDASTYCSYGFACGCGQDLQCSGGTWSATPAAPCP